MKTKKCTSATSANTSVTNKDTSKANKGANNGKQGRTQWIENDLKNANICYSNAIKMVCISLRDAVQSKQALQTYGEAVNLLKNYKDQIKKYGEYNFNMSNIDNGEYSDYTQDLVQETCYTLWVEQDINKGWQALNAMLYANSSKANRRPLAISNEIITEGESDLLYQTDIDDYNHWVQRGYDFKLSQEVAQEIAKHEQIANFIDFEIKELLTANQFEIFCRLYAGATVYAIAQEMHKDKSNIFKALRSIRKRILKYLLDSNSQTALDLLTYMALCV